MSSKRLFITKQDTFELSVLFTKEGEMKVSKVEDVPAEELEKWEKFDIEFSLPDYGTAKGIMRNSVDASGVQSANRFNNAMFISLAKKWSLKDDSGKEIPLDISKLNEMRPDITIFFIELLTEKLRKEGVYESVLLS